MEIKLKCKECDNEIQSDDTFVHDDAEYFHMQCYWRHVEEALWRLKDLDR